MLNGVWMYQKSIETVKCRDLLTSFTAVNCLEALNIKHFLMLSIFFLIYLAIFQLLWPFIFAISDVIREDNSKESNGSKNSVESGLELLRKSYGSQTEGSHWQPICDWIIFNSLIVIGWLALKL